MRTRLFGGTLVPMDTPGRLVPGGVVVIDGGRLAYVGPRDGAPLPGAGEREIDVRGHAVLPGLVQAHTHLCQTLFRSEADDLALLDWLRERIWPFEASHDARSLRASADLGISELLRGGTTAILDMGTCRHTDQVFEAAAEAGIRATIGKCHMDVDAGQPAPLLEETDASFQEAAQLLERWHGAFGDRLRYGFAPRFVLSCTEPLLRRVADAARNRGVVLHTHASENRDECRIVRAQTGQPNVAYFDRIGVLGPNAVLAHGIHLDEEEVSLLARSETTICHCPSSNLKLGSGIARVPELREAGVNVALGADGAPCNNNLDAFWEMRLAALIQKPRLGPTALPAWDVLFMATRAGARAIGLSREIGQLKEGFRADVIAVDLQDVALAPAGDLAGRLVYAAQSRHVRWVFVDGRPLVEDGTLTTLDPAEVAARARRERARLRASAAG